MSKFFTKLRFQFFYSDNSLFTVFHLIGSAVKGGDIGDSCLRKVYVTRTSFINGLGHGLFDVHFDSIIDVVIYSLGSSEFRRCQ